MSPSVDASRTRLDSEILVAKCKILCLSPPPEIISISRALELYLQRYSSEKRQLLDFLCSNSIGKMKLTVNFRKPFDSIVDMNSEMRVEKPNLTY